MHTHKVTLVHAMRNYGPNEVEHHYVSDGNPCRKGYELDMGDLDPKQMRPSSAFAEDGLPRDMVKHYENAEHFDAGVEILMEDAPGAYDFMLRLAVTMFRQLDRYRTIEPSETRFTLDIDEGGHYLYAVTQDGKRRISVHPSTYEEGQSQVGIYISKV